MQIPWQQRFHFIHRFRHRQAANHFAVLKGIPHKGERKEMVEGLLHQTNLWEARKRRVSTYSGGMRQRFGIAQTLLGAAA